MDGALFFWGKHMQFVDPKAIWELKFPLKLFAEKGANSGKVVGKLLKLVWDICGFGNFPPRNLKVYQLVNP